MKKAICLFLVMSTALLGGCGTNTSSLESSSASLTSLVSSNNVSSSSSSSSSTITSSSISSSISLSSASSISSISEDTTTYAVRFFGDQDALLEETTVKKGGTAVYKGNTPKKDGDERFTYKFNGWDKELTNIQADTDFHAVFVQTTYAYQVTWENPDGEILYQKYVKIGDTPVFYPDEFDTPYMHASATKYYTFKGWDHDITPVKDADQNYIATYDETDYSLTYKFDTDHYIVTGESTTTATGYFVPDTYDDGTNGEHPVTTIASEAFSNIANEVTLLKLGKNVTTIESKAFFAAWFSKIGLEEGSIFHTSDDHHVLYKDNEVVFFASMGIPVVCNTYTLPEGVTSIGDSVFYWNHYLKTLNLPDTVTEIKQFAFSNSYIANIHLGEGIKTIGNCAFRSASSLKTITLPKSLVSLGDSCFDSTSRLTTINYEGTKDDWAKVTLGTNWHLESAVTEITCTDGTVTL
ncbi:MAG: leucine-rich repeat domain-containing protein [Bacilli bacterium]|jgi:hypothetical protein|nr:leucine-rich repeat domain-containing protein [Bacilli bacterium]